MRKPHRRPHPGNLSPGGIEQLEQPVHDDVKNFAQPEDYPSIAQAAQQFGLKPTLLSALCDHLSCDDPDNTEAEDFTGLSEQEMEEEFASMVTEGKITKLELGNLRKFFRRLRDWFTPAEQAMTTPTADTANDPIILPKASDTDSYEFSVHLAQKTKGTFKKLPSQDSFKLRAAYRTCCGTEPPEIDRPSDLQISALAAWTAPSSSDPLGKHPYVDFAVMGPLRRTHSEGQAVLLHGHAPA